MIELSEGSDDVFGSVRPLDDDGDRLVLGYAERNIVAQGKHDWLASSHVRPLRTGRVSRSNLLGIVPRTSGDCWETPGDIEVYDG